ncbi:MAG: hypothetical protein RLZZ201_1441, partial [Actinomycetota bacterium]
MSYSYSSIHRKQPVTDTTLNPAAMGTFDQSG